MMCFYCLRLIQFPWTSRLVLAETTFIRLHRVIKNIFLISFRFYFQSLNSSLQQRDYSAKNDELSVYTVSAGTVEVIEAHSVCVCNLNYLLFSIHLLLFCWIVNWKAVFCMTHQNVFSSVWNITERRENNREFQSWYHSVWLVSE